jgi:hypothetical protein
LERALEIAKSAAQEGHDRAVEALSITIAEIDRAVTALTEFEGRARASQSSSMAAEAVARQRNRLQSEVRPRLEHDLQTVRDQLRTASPFTITLFGRTMAGKSTLMETLVGGDGRSIGKGQQRTTRDVREYTWNNLKIVDVPGIAAFGGKVDDDVAHTAAAKGDLILFLIDDNAPQAAEAEHLARLAMLGRPILGVVNVKMGVDPESLVDHAELDDFVERIEDRFSEERLNEMGRHLLAVAREFGADLRVEFRHTHLMSRYLSGRPDLAHARDRLAKASRFDAVENHISDLVISRGALLRHRTFADRVLPSLTDAMKMLWESSRLLRARSLENGALATQTRDCLDGFVQRADEKIRLEAAVAIGGLRSGLTLFVDRYVEDPKLDARWQEYVEQAKLPSIASDLQGVLHAECSKQLEGLLVSALRPLEWNRLMGRGDVLDEANIWNHRRTLNWIGVIAGASLAIAAAPVTVAVAVPFGIHAISRLFDTRAEKLGRARNTLISGLEKHLADVEKQFVTHLQLWVRKSLRDDGAIPVVTELDNLSIALEQIAATQYAMAGGLAAACKGALAWPLVRRALPLAGSRSSHDRGVALSMTGMSFEPYVQDVARVPTGLAVLCRSGFQLPGALRLELERLFGCPVHVVVDTGKAKENARQLLASADPRVQLVDGDGSGDLFVEARSEAMPAAMLDLASLFIERPMRLVTDDTAPRRGAFSTKREGTAAAPLNEGLRDRVGKLVGITGSGGTPTPAGKRK